MIFKNIPLKYFPIILLLLSQMCCWVFSGKTTKRPMKVPMVISISGGIGNPTIEKIILERIKATPKDQIAQYQSQAAKYLQANLQKMIHVLTRNDKRIPDNVRNSAKIILNNLKAGQLTSSLTNALPNLLVTFPKQGNAAQQLGTTLQSLLSYSPPQGSFSQLQILLSFVKENLNGVNSLLVGTLSGVPNLLQGVIGSLIGNLGLLNETLGNSLDSVGVLLGGLLG